VIDAVSYLTRMTAAVLREIADAVDAQHDKREPESQPFVVHIETVNVTGPMAEALAGLEKHAAARVKPFGMMWRRGDA
jgi:hypothetical protein